MSWGGGEGERSGEDGLFEDEDDELEELMLQMSKYLRCWRNIFCECSGAV